MWGSTERNFPTPLLSLGTTKILIFDEATSALDEKTEKQVLDSILKLKNFL